MRRANWRNKIHPSNLKHKISSEWCSSLKGKQYGYFFKSIKVLYLPTELLKFNRLILMLKGFETPITRGVFKTYFPHPKAKEINP